MTTMNRRLRLLVAVIALALFVSACSFWNWLDDGTAIAQTTQTTYPIVDSGQEVTYDNASDGSPEAGSGASQSSNSPVLGSTYGVQDAFASRQDEDFILFAPLAGEEAYLIDRSGEVIHDWNLSGPPGNSVYLLEGGDLLATYTVEGDFHGGGIGGGVERLTWNGERVWSFELATENAHLHHDIEILPNGNVLMISWEAMRGPEVRAAGLMASQLPASGQVWSEMILEYDPSIDQIVWEWHLWDHRLPSGWEAAEHPEKIDLDLAASQKTEDWWHLNAVDYNAELDQIVLSSRMASEIWMIDHALTTVEAVGDAGDLLYRFGNPSMHGGSGMQIFYGQHDAEWLGWPVSGGAGSTRILLFDNGDTRERPYSRVVELALPNYASSSTGVFPEPQIIWEYPHEERGDAAFFADHISGAQRLEDGDTLICIGTEGRFLEVTPEGTIVWEYVNPFTGIGPGGKPSNEVFRCEAYSAEHVGQDLAR